jgi:hypothetical protein
MPKRKTRKRKVERVHTASAYLSVNSLTKAGSSLWLDIAADGHRIGKLEIGRGGLFWSGARRWRTTRKRISWSRFADIMDELAYG